MIRNIAMAIDSMQNDLPGLEVTSLKLDDIVAKQRKARVSTSMNLITKTTIVPTHFCSHSYPSHDRFCLLYKVQRSTYIKLCHLLVTMAATLHKK